MIYSYWSSLFICQFSLSRIVPIGAYVINSRANINTLAPIIQNLFSNLQFGLFLHTWLHSTPFQKLNTWHNHPNNNR